MEKNIEQYACRYQRLSRKITTEAGKPNIEINATCVTWSMIVFDSIFDIMVI